VTHATQACASYRTVPETLAELVMSRRVLVAVGAGGVGKTTTAAALGVAAARRGKRVLCLTIDPARRLAEALGMERMSADEQLVAPELFERAGIPLKGSLTAMMLDTKRTFDELVVKYSSSPERAKKLLENRLYKYVSTTLAGTQEYMAMEKLAQLKQSGDWDLIIVDTPPTRSALDFLDAPQNLSRFLDGRLLKLLLAPARAGGKAYFKVVSTSLSLFSRVFTKVLGMQLLEDVSQFVAALETMFGGFRERATQTYELLAAPGTAFVVIATPEPAAVREASFFVDRLAEERMPLAGVVLNRVHEPAPGGLTGERALAAAEVLEAAPDDAPDAENRALALALLRLHAESAAASARDARARRRFTRSHPDVALAQVPARAGDVHDLAQLRLVGADLARRETAAVS
jgi:anion-transporting  ArsA/GET3 family ATPase